MASDMNDLVTAKEVISLTSLGIDENLMTCSHVTMQSEKYICVRESNSSIVIIDIAKPNNQPLRLSITADSTIINPTTCSIIAVKARIKETNQDLLQIISVEENNKINITKSYNMAKQVVFWKWITPKLLGLVTDRTVYHWSIEGLLDPVKMFDRNRKITLQKIINYQCDPSEKWLALSGIMDNEGRGKMQLFSVEEQNSRIFDAYVGSFATFKVEENDDIPSTLLCVTGHPVWKRLYVYELNAKKTGFYQKKKYVDFWVASPDFTLAMQTSQKYGLIYGISKLGLLHVHDLATALPFDKVKISEVPIVLTMEATTSGGFYAINAKGQVLLTNVNNDRLVSFISAKYLQSFNELIEENKFMRAAQLAVDSPHGLLRTPETSHHVRAGLTHPLRLYLNSLLNKTKLNVDESLELFSLVIKQNEIDLFKSWLDEDKLECSEELGDRVKTVDSSIALKIYLKMGANQKVLDAFAEERSKMCMSIEKEREKRMKLEQVLEADRSKFEKQEKYYQKKIDELCNKASEKSQELEQKLFDARTQIKEIEESLETEAKRKKETEVKLAINRRDLHDLQKIQQEMLNEIEGLKMENAELQNEKDKIEGFDFSSNHLEANYTKFTYEEIKAATDDFNNIYKIGEGGYGVVYKAFLRHTMVAIKIVKSEGFQSEREFNQEVKILSRIRHPNLVMLLGACPEAQALVYELMPNGSLHDILSNKYQSKTLTWKMRIRIASNICSALIYLHSAKPGIVHGDLKSSNILLDLNYMAKISDFGICRQLYQTETKNTPHHYTLYPKGTLAYMDPEYLNTGELTSQYDVYSFGIVLLELVTGRVTMGLRKMVADALKKGEQFVDTSAGEWPFDEVKKLVQLGIRCSDNSRLNRPDLVKEVWGEIESMELASFRR